MTADAPLDDQAMAAIGLIGRSHASGFQLRYQDDEEPTVWLAVAVYPDGRFDAGAGATPRLAVMRLCTQLMDGGLCTHCKRPSMFDDAPFNGLEPPESDTMCWYRYDPELRTYRRSCEGDT